MLVSTAALLVLTASAPLPPQQKGASAIEWHVDASNLPPGTGSTTDPFYSITYALGHPSVESGDTVTVAPGIYRSEIIDFGGKSVTLRSTSGPNFTVIEAPLSADPGLSTSIVKIESGATDVVIDGFHFRGGTGSRDCSNFSYAGGGAISICSSTARVTDCTFQGNRADRGGAIFVYNGRLELEDVRFSGPGFDALGEAIYARNSSILARRTRFEDLRLQPLQAPQGQSAVVLEHSVALFDQCTFERNATSLFGAHIWSRNSDTRVTRSTFGECWGYAGTALAVLGGSLTLSEVTVQGATSMAAPGAGLFASSAEITIAECIFERNVVDGGREGGAIAVSGGTLDVTDSWFDGNVAGDGGAISIAGGAHASMQRSTFIRNRAHFDGGAIHVGQGLLDGERLVFNGNAAVAASSTGGAVCGAATLGRSTLHGNIAGLGGGGGGATSFVGSVLWGNVPADLDFTCSASYSIVGEAGGAALEFVLDRDPQFFARDDLHLIPGSPAIDALPMQFGTDDDGTAGEFGAFSYDPTYCGEDCSWGLGSVGCPTVRNSTGGRADLQANGNPSLEEDRLLLLATGMPPGVPVVVLASQSGAFVPFHSSPAPLCLGPVVHRLPPGPVTSRPDGSLGFWVQLVDENFEPIASAGETWHFQAWFRDAQGEWTSNMTSSIAVPLR